MEPLNSTSFSPLQIQWSDLPATTLHTGLHGKAYLNDQLVGEVKLYFAPTNLSSKDLLTFFDEIELIAVEFYHESLENKQLYKKLTTQRFAYLTELRVQADYQNQGIGGQLLEAATQILKTLQISSVYLVSTADTKREEAKLHHLYANHYYTYLTVHAPGAPALMQRQIEEI